MARKSGSLKTKRADAPRFWKISKKDKRFVVRTEPGPHGKDQSYPLLVLMRDILSIAKNSREAMTVLNSGKIMVDGRIIRSPRFPVGLMDVVDLPSINRSFRLIPRRGGIEPVEITDKEKNLKMCIVKSKKTLRSAKTACGLHDGRVIYPAAEVDVRPGDSLVLRLPEQELQASYRLSNGSLALLVRGERSGEVITVEDVKPGTFSRGSIATVRFADGSTSELPSDALMPLGKQLPNITIASNRAS
jgi:small subunit ribosomal protein S4e